MQNNFRNFRGIFAPAAPPGELIAAEFFQRGFADPAPAPARDSAYAQAVMCLGEVEEESWWTQVASERGLTLAEFDQRCGVLDDFNTADRWDELAAAALAEMELVRAGDMSTDIAGLPNQGWPGRGPHDESN